MPDCTPPEGTPDGTLCVLRRDDDVLVLIWRDCRSYRSIWQLPGLMDRKGARSDWKLSLLGAEGWRFAGICPELPDVKPQTAQEIAREALERTSNATGVIIGDDVYSSVVVALRRIAELPE